MVSLSRSPLAVTGALLIGISIGVDITVEAAKKNYNQPHPHRGILKPYSPGPFDLKLTKSDEKDLAAGKSVMKQSQPAPGELSGNAICVQDIDAPKEAVWSQILDLDSYKGKVPKVTEAKNYEVTKNRDGTTRIKTKMVVGVIPGYSFTSFYDHTLDPKKNSMTWRLDYDKTSDFGDVSGHWHVEPVPGEPDKTRVFYACDVALDGAMPKPIMNYLSKSALKTATGWVKKNSESKKTASIPSQYASPSLVE